MRGGRLCNSGARKLPRFLFRFRSYLKIWSGSRKIRKLESVFQQVNSLRTKMKISFSRCGDKLKMQARFSKRRKILRHCSGSLLNTAEKVTDQMVRLIKLNFNGFAPPDYFCSYNNRLKIQNLSSINHIKF